MRIAVLGATGMAGRAIVAEARGRGHAVVAGSRRSGPANASPHGSRHAPLEQRVLDVGDAQALGSLLREVPVLVLAIRPRPQDEVGAAELTRGVLDIAARTGTRVLVVGGAAPLRSPQAPETLVVDDPRWVPPAWQGVARASLDQFRACAEHDRADWVYISPSAVFEDGEGTGHYRRGTTTLLADDRGRSRITASDLAIAVLDEIEHPRDKRHVTVIEDSGRGRRKTP